MAIQVTWVIDTSSVAEVRRSIENAKKPGVFLRMEILVNQSRLVYPKQVVDELERWADPGSPDPQYVWAKKNEAKATEYKPTLDQVKEVLRVVPRVLDPDKDTGVEEADPYILALAVQLRVQSSEARIITEEKNDTPRKLSLRTAAGLMGVPSVPLRAFLEFENII